MRSTMCRPVTTASHPAWQPDPLRMLVQSRELLQEAARADSPAERFRLAHLSALRTAATICSARARPGGRRRPTNAWVLVRSLAPELGEWASYFAAAAAQRAAVEAGAVHAVTVQGAVEQLHAATEFLVAVEESVGLLAARLAG